MKVLWFNHRDPFNSRAGGAERTMDRVATGLSELGHNVAVACPSKEPTTMSVCDIQYSVIRLNGNIISHLRVPEVLARERPDVVIEDLAHVVPWFSRSVAGLPGIAYFRHLHRRTLPGQAEGVTAGTLRVLERMYPLVYGHWPFVTESVTSVEDLTTMGINSSAIHRIPPGVDLQRFRIGFRSDNPTVIYFGGLKGYKRPEHAVQAFSRLLAYHPNSRMFVVGNGPAEPNVRAVVRSLRIDESVEFTGRLSDAALVSLLASSWANIHCSVAEGWCLSAMEAAASGVPTIAYKVPGLIDSVSNGVSGLLVTDDRPEELAAALLQVVESCGEWPDRCREWASRFPWDRTIESWEALIRSTAAKKSHN